MRHADIQWHLWNPSLQVSAYQGISGHARTRSLTGRGSALTERRAQTQTRVHRGDLPEFGGSFLGTDLGTKHREKPFDG
jgi:hypothetical protein